MLQNVAKIVKMSFPAEQLAALIRQSQQIAELRMKEKIRDPENSSDSPQSPSNNSDQV